MVNNQGGIMKKLTQEEVINRFIVVHGNYYDYSKVKYDGAYTDVTIICPRHGEFQQAPHNHARKYDCTKCAREFTGKTFSHEKVIKLFRKAHGDKYDYSKVKYKKLKAKVIIICPIHGEFKQAAGSHSTGSGCESCSSLTAGLKTKKTTAEFIKQANEVHNGKYDYSKTEYHRAHDEVIIICLEHGEFEQAPHSHIKGSGCISCAKSGFDPGKPGILYYVSVNDGQAYKIGITNQTIQQRFRTDISKITVIQTTWYSNGGDCRRAETEILRIFKDHRWRGEDLLMNGNTEMFDNDVLGLDD